MPNLPRPKVLPRVNYAPPSNAPNGMQTQGSVGVSNPYIDIVGDPSSQVTKPQGWEDTNAMRPLQGNAGAQMSSPLTVTYDPNPVVANYGLPLTAVGNTPSPSVSPSNAVDPRVQSHIDMAKQNQADAQRLMDAANKNRANTTNAQAAGDTASLARLNAEWERIQQSPLWKQMYGGSDPNAMKQRLVNVYMNPKNSAAQNDLAGALSSAVADDVWAREATRAGVLSGDPNDPRNQLVWDEHWKAMNVGGRDPLEGHPQAIQNIKATMQGFSNNNQQTAYDDYSNWAGGH